MRRPAARPSLSTSRTEGSCGTRPSARTASVWPPALTRGFESGTWPAARRRQPGRPIPRPADCLAFSPDGERLATGSLEGLVELWDTATGQKVQVFKGHFGTVHAMAFGPDGTRLATGGADGTLRLWDATSRRDAVSVPKDGLSFSELPELSPDGQTLLTDHGSGMRRRLRLWDTATGQPRCSPIELPHAVVSQAWTGDGRRLYSTDSTKTMRVLDVASGKIVRTVQVDAEPNLATASPQCRREIVRPPGQGGTIQVRNAQTGALFRTIGGLDRLPRGPWCSIRKARTCSQSIGAGR